MDAFLSFLIVVGLFAIVVAVGAALQTSIGSNGMLADSSIRYQQREELGLGRFGRSIRSVTTRR